MKKVLLILLTTLLLSSCSSKAVINNDFQALEVNGHSKLLEKLEEEHYRVIEDGVLDHSVLRGDASYLKLSDDMTLQIYEYFDRGRLDEDLNSISDDGYSIAEVKNNKNYPGTDYGWIDRPHFHLFKNLIVLYVGSDLDFITFLDEVSDEAINE